MNPRPRIWIYEHEFCASEHYSSGTAAAVVIARVTQRGPACEPCGHTAATILAHPRDRSLDRDPGHSAHAGACKRCGVGEPEYGNHPTAAPNSTYHSPTKIRGVRHRCHCTCANCIGVWIEPQWCFDCSEQKEGQTGRPCVLAGISSIVWVGPYANVDGQRARIHADQEAAGWPSVLEQMQAAHRLRGLPPASWTPPRWIDGSLGSVAQFAGSVRALATELLPWRPDASRHAQYAPAFRQVVVALLALARRADGSWSVLPPELLCEILSRAAAATP